MTIYEYTRLSFDWNDLGTLNRLSQEGWRVVGISSPATLNVFDGGTLRTSSTYLLLERPKS